ncbi:MAG: TonB-dependent receptor plug domain-containing protein, partial [Dinghuibacter sp.]|nr:TonB-dependent receptor plug domain-containing protein [Dinghuibacter sp.]
MKTLLTGLLFLSIQLHAQPPVKNSVLPGKIIDLRTAETLSGVAISVLTEGQKRPEYMYSDSAGTFRLPVPFGKKAKLEFSLPGYKNHTLNIRNNNIKSLLVRMEPASEPPAYMQSVQPDPLKHIPVEVRSVRSLGLAPFTKTDLKAADLERLNLGRDIPFLLNETPSVLSYADAGTGVGYTGMRIRGSDLSRINMTINGIPYNDAESQGIFFVDLPDFASSVSSLQIQRGVGSSSNGAGAFGATLSFSTRSEQEKPYVEFNNSYGSFETRKHTMKIGTGMLKSGFSADIRLSSIRSDGFSERASVKLDGYYISTGYKKNRTSVLLNLISGHEKTY